MSNNTYIFIDGSYFCFYRYHSLLTWWRNAYPEQTDVLQDPYANDKFVEKFNKTFIDNAQRLAEAFLLHKGFTVGYKDSIPSKELRQQIIDLMYKKELEAAHLLTEIENNPDLMDQELFENTLFSELNVPRDDIGKLLQANNTLQMELEDKNAKKTPEEKEKDKNKKPVELGSADDFMLTQAVAFINGQPVKRSSSKLE